MASNGCKVCRVLVDRDMQDYESRLVDHWKGRAGPRKGYRQLADWFNVTLFRREMDKAGLSTLGDEPQSKYDRLQKGGAVAEELRTSVRTAGVPIDELEGDFVSYGVIRTHLTECLGEEYHADTGDWEADAIEIARSHATTKITEAVRAACSKGKLRAVGDITVNVSVELECDATHVSVPVDRALRRGYVSKETGTAAPGPETSDENSPTADRSNPTVGEDG